jgi:hypothetical protein
VQAARASAAARKATIARKQGLIKTEEGNDDNSPISAVSGSESSPASASTSAAEDRHKRSVSSKAESEASIPTSQLKEMEISRVYPTTKWHPQMPEVVEYFLSLFAPTLKGEHRTGREDIRSQLWPQAQKDAALFHALLLIAASHATVAGALSIQPDLISQLKYTTLENINTAIEWAGRQGGMRDPVVAAIALLGAWELVS